MKNKEETNANVQFGMGMNSLQIRFSCMVLLLTSLSSAGVMLVLPAADSYFWPVMIAGATVLASAGAIYFASGILAGQIRELTTSAAKIAAGELDTEVTINCKCDVGGLANNMREMLGTLRANFDSITNLAHFDQVTGLPNRLHLSECLGKRVAESTMDISVNGAILYMDLNGFKKVNDTFGHEVGDKLLHAVSERILAVTHQSSVAKNKTNAMDPERGCRLPVLARFGGDEFILHLPGKVLSRDISIESDKILRALERPFDIEGRMVNVGTSIGVARYPADATDGETLIRYADLAMYTAKQDGKLLFSFFDPEYLRDAVDHRELELDLKTAIQAGELEVYYQPKIDLETRHCSGVEALVRWNHPKRGLLGPGNFIDIAENTGMIVELGNFVMERAIRQSAEFAHQGVTLKIAINVSLAQLEQDDFSLRVTDLLQQWTAPPESIILEITESVASINIQKIQSQMRPLRSMGVKFSIDDFGTGYSNLAKLLNLRCDELKIDRSLISNIKYNPQHREAVRMIAGLGANMGCQVLAEGIETEEQYEMVRKLGCHEVQGFLFAKPLPLKQLRVWLIKWERSGSENSNRSAA